jgi:adenosylcobinamide kinase/adenosylcobinamide-phosphate guanylyltransferase
MFSIVTGGSASGKSEYAENLVPNTGSRVYLATMEPFGAEAETRIARHRKLREGKGFETIECPVNIEKVLEACRGKDVLLEDLPNLVANEMFSSHAHSTSGIAEQILDLAHISESLICVTGILTADGRKYDESTMKYLKELAAIERTLAAHADRVIEVVCGRGSELKRSFRVNEDMKEQNMIFVTGPMFSGKREYIKSALNLSDEELAKRAVWNVEELVSEKAVTLEALADELASKEIVIADEIGCGLVPLDASEREKRERAGRLACMLAERADTVIRVVCGCPQVLKGAGGICEISGEFKWQTKFEK